MALLLEVALERRVVLDDAVVDDRDAVAEARVVAVRVGVLLGDAAVGRPARVGDAHRALEVLLRPDHALDVGDAADRARDMQAAVHHGDAGRVVAAVLEALEALEKDAGSLAMTDIGDDSTHGRGPLRGTSRGPPWTP
jgi:hypothetical protein